MLFLSWRVVFADFDVGIDCRSIFTKDTLDIFPVQWMTCFSCRFILWPFITSKGACITWIRWVQQLLQLEIGLRFYKSRLNLMKGFFIGFLYSKGGFQCGILYAKMWASESWWLGQHTQSIRHLEGKWPS